MLDIRGIVRKRQTLMQLALWLLLGATVALAALVDRSLRHGLYFSLTEPITEGQISYSLPAEWHISARPGDGDASVRVAIDPAGSSSGNCLITVVSQRIDALMTPAEYLHFSGQLTGRNAEIPSETVLVDDWPGEWIPWVSRASGSAGNSEIGESRGIAFALVLPNRQSLSILLERNGALERRDVRLFKQIVDSLRVTIRPGSGPITLADGTQIAVPSDFIVYEQPDPLCEERMVIQKPGKGGWISAQFIGMLVNPPPTPALLTTLAAHEHLDFRDPLSTIRWLHANIDRETATRWRIDPKDPADHLIHRRAYVLSGSKGAGLAVVMTAISPAGDAELDSAWASLAANIRLGAGPDLDALIEAGVKVVPQVSAAPEESAQVQWWLWSRSHAPAGWTRCTPGQGDQMAQRLSARRNWEGTATRVEERWSYSINPPGAMARMIRYDAEAEPGSSLESSADQTTGVADTLITRINLGQTQLNALADSTPRAFVLSSHFPQILGRLPDWPVALWTDRFPGADDELLAWPILLVARRGDSDESGLRCEEVRFNGTARVSRWYFRGDGTLDHAEFPGDWSLRASSQSEIETDLTGDARLTVHQP